MTIGIARLREILARFGARSEHAVTDIRQKALMITPSGEKHNFGVEIIAKFLRDAGWDVTVSIDCNFRECANLVASEWFAVVGLTISSPDRLESLARTIEVIRKNSCNRSIGVMVGGPLFNQRPELAALVDADAAALDAPTAVALAKRLLVLGAVKH